MLACHCDPSDLAHDLAAGARGIVVLDCRSAEAHAAARLPGAIALPWATIDAAAVAALPPAHVYVTYCWGQACNAGARGAARLAALGLPVKELLGGIAAWEAEGAPLERG
jgi:rhodanese-related sulfurtransferase